MRRTLLLPLVTTALALTAACADNANAPTTLPPVPDARVQAITPANAPSGTHFQAGTSAKCAVSGITVSCTSYELAGVGNANAQANLTASYSAIVDCRNHGGKVVPVKSQVEAATVSTGALEPKNGRLVVPALSTGTTPSDADFKAQAVCPNGNWTKEVQDGSRTLSSYLYTLTFVGFPGAYITLP